MRERISRSLLLGGAIAAVIGVALGAFGAHALKATVSPEHLATFETAVRYQMYHAFALIAAGLACNTFAALPAGRFTLVGWLWGAGIGLFCGSLYLLVLFNIPWLGVVTPLGGLAFLAGWVVLAITVAGRV